MNLKIKIDSGSINELKSILSSTVEKVVQETIEKMNISNTGLSSDEDLLTRKEVMKMLNISHSTLYHHQRKGTIPFLKIGSRVYFRRDDIFNNPDLDGENYNYAEEV